MQGPVVGVAAGALTAVMIAAAGCSPEPQDTTQPPEPVTPEAGAAHVVTGQAPPAVHGFPSVVELEPNTPMEYPASRERPVMDQAGISFFPSVLLARVGQPVEFRNSEDVLHNVRVFERATGTTEFNVSTPVSGVYEHTFERPGRYAVSCDVHPGMAAVVLVTSTPWTVIAEADGRFSLPDVPPGEYTLTVHSGGQQSEHLVQIDGPQTELIVDDVP